MLQTLTSAAHKTIILARDYLLGGVPVRQFRILVVDDEERILNFLRSKLKASGYEVFTAPNGPEALEQALAQDPDLMLFDEPESGVDMENIALVGETIAKLLQKDVTATTAKSKMALKMKRKKMGLIITHTGYILDYISADKGQVLFNGKLSCISNPREILRCVGEAGYEECVRCITGMN